MCGIFCSICLKNGEIKKDVNLLQRIKNRGPDSVIDNHIFINDKINLHLTASVLWMQGSHLVPQPIETYSGVLLFNGDIFDPKWHKGGSKSDTELIKQRLSFIEQNQNQQGFDNKIINFLKSLIGPFSLIYYNKVNCTLFFTRDRIGRSSLLFHKDNNSIIISNVLARTYKCVEVPATSINIYNINTNVITTYNWYMEQNETYDLDTWLNNLQHKQSICDEEFDVDCIDDAIYNTQDDIVYYIENIAAISNNKEEIFQKLLENDIILKTVMKLIALLVESVKIRVKTQPNKCNVCINKEELICNHCTVGVLFSGGLDCTILAYLANNYVDKNQPIDLINVAFSKDHDLNYDVPDRVTGKQSYEELKSSCKSRNWMFKEVNVPKDEIEEYQQTRIADLVYPRQTILDESLGTALWFAARCKDTTCRVLLLGSGADELFGGYSRHRNAFKRHGWKGLHKELNLDWKRISFRNLARDNRVICDHGRQPRMPYLDEHFTDYVTLLDPWLRCFPSEKLEPGLGDKLMLRLVAYKLGLRQVVSFPKRALQFGSRIANKKEKGSDISKNFKIHNKTRCD